MRQAMSSEWPSIADLLSDRDASVALLGAPLEAGSVTPGRCDLAPHAVRAALKRISTYDLEAGLELDMPVRDLGDLAVRGLMPADAFAPIRKGVALAAGMHELTLLIGGNNAVTRPAAHGLGVPLDQVGLITLDAHFDLRATDAGPRNGNPIRCLLEDGLPGTNICQIGLAPFANTAAMHRDAVAAGIGVWTASDVRREGILPVLDAALARLGHAERIMVDFDIDVIDRAQMPGAPGARPGGIPVADFFAAARELGAAPRVALVDLTEFDPSLDATDLSALTAARWVAEILAGFSMRGAA
jgi:arginase family enzyme